MVSNESLWCSSLVFRRKNYLESINRNPRSFKLELFQFLPNLTLFWPQMFLCGASKWFHINADCLKWRFVIFNYMIRASIGWECPKSIVMEWGKFPNGQQPIIFKSIRFFEICFLIPYQYVIEVQKFRLFALVHFVRVMSLRRSGVPWSILISPG